MIKEANLGSGDDVHQVRVQRASLSARNPPRKWSNPTSLCVDWFSLFFAIMCIHSFFVFVVLFFFCFLFIVSRYTCAGLLIARPPCWCINSSVASPLLLFLCFANSLCVTGVTSTASKRGVCAHTHASHVNRLVACMCTWVRKQEETLRRIALRLTLTGNGCPCLLISSIHSFCALTAHFA